MQAWLDDAGKIQIALDPANRAYEAQLARVWFKRYASRLTSAPGMSEWDLAARTAELEAAIANADRAEAAKSMNQLSQKAREWTDDRCVAAAEVYLSQTGNLKRSYKLREATKLANQTEAKAYIVRGLERLLSGPKHEETAAALKELSKKN